MKYHHIHAEFAEEVCRLLQMHETSFKTDLRRQKRDFYDLFELCGSFTAARRAVEQQQRQQQQLSVVTGAETGNTFSTGQLPNLRAQ